MDDLISRSALLKEIESLQMVVTGLRAGKGVLREFMNQYKESMLQIIDEQPKVDWIPCEERLPLPKGNEQMVEVDVTVAGDGRNVRVPGFYFFATCNFHVYGIGGAKIKNVIAWMPKPQPYKAGDTNDST